MMVRPYHCITAWFARLSLRLLLILVAPALCDAVPTEPQKAQNAVDVLNAADGQDTEPTAQLPEKHRTLLNSYCMECHRSEVQEGNFDLENLSMKISSIEQAEQWQKVLNVVNAGEMPPEESEQLIDGDKADFLDDLANTMVAARRILADSGGEIMMRRLNRREYQNTIRSLTGVKLDISSLPPDGGSGVFDTFGSSQFISSDQFEQYLKLGRIAIDEAFDRHASQTKPPSVFRVEPETTVNVQTEQNMRKMEETYQRYLRWKAKVDEAASAPENQAVVQQIRDRYSLKEITDSVRLYQNADLLKGIPDAKEFGFKDSNDASFSYQGGYGRSYAYMKHYSELPQSDRGTYLKLAWGIQRIDISPDPKQLPPGTYRLRIRAGKVAGTPESRHFIEIGHPQRVNQVPAGFAGLPISSHQVTGTLESPEVIETEIEIGINTPRELGIQERRTADTKRIRNDFFKHKRENGYGTPPAIWVDWIELEGPINSNTWKPNTWKQRREVEVHANVKVGGTYNGYFKGGYEQAQAFLKTGQSQKGIVDQQEAEFRIRQFEEQGPTFRRYLDNPLTQSGALLTISNVNKEEFIALPPEHPTGWRKSKHIVDSLPSGNYKLRFRAGAVEGTPSERHFIDLGLVPTEDEFQHLATFHITAPTDQAQVIEFPVQLTTNGPRKFAIREKRDPNLDQQRDKKARDETGLAPVPAIWIDWVEWEGPLGVEDGEYPFAQTLAMIKQAQTDNSEISLARQILRRFATDAFRDLSPNQDFIERLVNIFEGRRNSGEPFEVAIRTPLSVILASPGFLYLNEPSVDASPRTLNDRELAVRLSYFLWSGPPDKELLELAEQNRLHLPQVLRQQTNRLINDARSDAFVSGFVHQWLDMERLDFFQFDANLHPDFDESTRSATREEVYQSFAHLLRDAEQDSSSGRLVNLLKSDYVFVNGLLATYYGIEGVEGDEFQKVKLPSDSPRGGLLGMAAIHAMGSDGIVSSPVERGAWVLRHLLNDPPPPAPPNVPQISRLEDQILSTRERLLAHQEEAQCASCHRKIDPIGFGLENFNAAGKWRTEDSYQLRDQRGRGIGKRKTWEIDASGAFYLGPKFANFRELRERVADQEDAFARGLIERLTEYGLGRPFGFTDGDLADEIFAIVSEKEFVLREFIHALVASSAFQTK